MSNELALRNYENAQDQRERREAAARQYLYRLFAFECMNDVDYFATRFAESLERVEAKDDALLGCVHALIVNRTPGEDARYLRELRDQFRTHCRHMAEDFYEDDTLEELEDQSQ